MSNKKYGLIVSDRGKPVFQASRNVFGNDSDSDEDSNKKPVLLRPSDNTARQAKITQEKAMLEDPTVYQYDEIYDDMAIKKEKINSKTKEEKKPQYIENLMKAATKRKMESERRIERQIQKEREKEGDEFKDKEVFVTSAYKKKLEELRLEEEKEKRDEYLENIGDVTKQRDLGGFYRHIYEQKMGKDEKKIKTMEENTEPNKVEEKNNKVAEKNNKNSTQVTPNPSDSQKKRNYRKRKSSDSKPCLSDGEIEESDEEINRVNLDDIRKAKKHKQDENIDADSDFSIDESSDEEADKKIVDNTSKQTETVTDRSELADDNKLSADTKVTHESKEQSLNKKEKEEPEVKVDIWKKRTVGQVFDEALRRYYERKAARGC